MPFEGDAFFTSQMKERPGRFRAVLNWFPVPGPAAAASSFIYGRETFSISAATRSRA